jgi:RimJ/RimL family protein N-acetyltransferase
MLGISIIDAYQRNGYGPEAINWALDWAFKFGGMHRVGLTCYGFNDRGQRLYERLGFVKEETIRERLWFDGAWHDEIYYGMLESEWGKLRSSQKAEQLA